MISTPTEPLDLSAEEESDAAEAAYRAALNRVEIEQVRQRTDAEERRMHAAHVSNGAQEADLAEQRYRAHLDRIDQKRETLRENAAERRMRAEPRDHSSRLALTRARHRRQLAARHRG